MKYFIGYIAAFIAWSFFPSAGAYLTFGISLWKSEQRKPFKNLPRERRNYSSIKNFLNLAGDENPVTSFKARVINSPKAPLDKPQNFGHRSNPDEVDYAVNGPLSTADFVLSREGPAVAEELVDENLLKIIRQECTDLEVNTLVWKCLGYRYEVNDNGDSYWANRQCFPNVSKNNKFKTMQEFM